MLVALTCHPWLFGSRDRLQARNGEADSTPDDILRMVREQAAPSHRRARRGLWGWALLQTAGMDRWHGSPGLAIAITCRPTSETPLPLCTGSCSSCSNRRWSGPAPSGSTSCRKWTPPSGAFGLWQGPQIVGRLRQHWPPLKPTSGQCSDHARLPSSLPLCSRTVMVARCGCCCSPCAFVCCRRWAPAMQCMRW